MATSRTSPRYNINGLKEPVKMEGERKSSVVASSRPRSSQSFILPSTESIKPPTSSLDCKKMLELGKRMLLTAVDYQGSGLRHNERALLDICLETVAMKISKGRNLPTSLSSGVSSSSLARHLPSSTQRRSDFNQGGSTPPSNSSSTNSGSGSRMTKSPSSAENCMNGSRHSARSSPTSMSKRSRSPSSAGSSWSGSSCRGRSPSARRRRTRSSSIADGYKRDTRIKRERSVAESNSRGETFSSSKKSPSYRNGGNETKDSGREDGYHMGGERQRRYDEEEARARRHGYSEDDGGIDRNQDSCYKSDDGNMRERDYEESNRGRRDSWSGGDRYGRQGGGNQGRRGGHREGW